MILDIDKYCTETIIDKRYIPEITSTSIKQSNGMYDPRGLFSGEYFGQENSSTWKNMFAKIVIPHPVIHPSIFYIINRRVSYLLKWINLDFGFIKDKDSPDSLILTNQVNKYDYCGISDLYANSALICDALLRTEKFDTLSAKTILQRIVDRKIPIFVKHVIVTPPAFRPPDLKVSSDQENINKFYIKILDEINILRSSMTSNDKILTNRILANIQNLYNQLFEAMIDKIKGKTGLVRGAMLGKNADFSGRAVIVGDPLIKPSQLGIPRTMLIRLFYPWIINYVITHKEVIAALQKLGVQVNITRLFELINRDLFEKNIDSNIVAILNKCMEEVIKGKVIIAKRDPVLHKLSVRGFHPVPVDDSSIHISPLVCNHLNADFDGDQMAVFVPLTNKAQTIVKDEMLATKNLYAPREGLSFTIEKDYILGIYFMTKDELNKDQSPIKIPDSTSANDFIAMVYKADSFAKPVTYRGRTNTIGRRCVELLFNDYVKIEEKLNDKKVGKLLETIVNTHPEDLEDIMYRILKVSAVTSSFIGGTMSIKDFKIDDDLQKRRDEVISNPVKYDVDAELKNITKEFMKRQNSSSQLPVMLVDSGARGSAGNIQQISVAKGYISDANGKTLADPIGSNFSDGFKPVDYFTSAFGNRKGVVDRALNTASSGYLQRQMIYLAASVKSSDLKNCNTNRFFTLPLTEEYLEVLSGRILSNGEYLTKEYAERHNLIGKKIQIYSPLYCKSHDLCMHCYPSYYRKLIDNAHNVGMISANILGERGSQLIMRQFHCLSSQTLVYMNNRNTNEYGLHTLYDLFDKRRDKVVYTLNNTQQEIDVSDENLYTDDNGSWTKVLKIIRHKRNPNSKMVWVNTYDNHSLVTQDNHRVFVKRYNNIELIEPKDIKVNNDCLIISPKENFIWQEEKRKCFIDGYILGRMIGSGSITIYKKTKTNLCKRSYRLKIATQNGEYENKIRTKLVKIIKDSRKPLKVDKTSIFINSTSLANEYLSKCGKHSQVKHLPAEFIYYDDETLLKILCGLIDSSGSIRWKSKESRDLRSIVISINNIAIINSIKCILDKFGIKSNTYLGSYNKKNYQMYCIEIYPDSDQLKKYFYESVKCSDCIVTTKQGFNNNSCIKDVKNILFRDDLDEYSYVYDFTTETHRLSVNGIHSVNTGGASSVLYLTKEAPQLSGIIAQENNTLIANQDIRIKVMDYESSTVDIYVSRDFTVYSDNNEYEIHFKGDIEFNALMAYNVKEDDGDIILSYNAGDTIGEISAQTTDTTNAVKTVQRILTHSYQSESGEDLVLELYEIFNQKIQLLHFEILVSQLMRDPKKPYYPYRYGSMTEKPKFIPIKSVPSFESPKRGIMFERILDTVTNSIINGDNTSDQRVHSDLESLFDI